MINLLSRQQKQTIQKEYNLRSATVFLAGIFALEVFSVIAFGFVYQIIANNAHQLAFDLEQKKKYAPQGSDTITQNILRIKADADTLDAGRKNGQVRASDLLVAISSMKPAGIVIESFNYSALGEDTVLEVGGVADSRNDLIYFQNVLRNDGRFKDVLYNQSFVQIISDIDFILKLKLDRTSS